MANPDSKVNEKNPRNGPAQVSSFFREGAFSGADIRVHVHYNDIKEYSASLGQKVEKLSLQVDTKQNEAKALKNAIGEATRKGENLKADLFNERLKEVESATKVLTDEIDEINNKLSKIKVLPATRILGELQTISYSVNREKSPVRTLGSVYARGYVRGPRTIGGTMIFTILHEHVLHEILELDLGVVNTGTSDSDVANPYTTAMPDQLPPLNLSLEFANEYGAISHMGLYGVEFVLEGSTFSVHDIYSENTVTFIARDMDPMHRAKKRETNKQGLTGDVKNWSTKASSLSENILREKGRKLRRNPFI